MSTVQEIKTAIERVGAREQALLRAKIFAESAEPDRLELEAALERGLADVKAGRVYPAEEVRKMILRWAECGSGAPLGRIAKYGLIPVVGTTG